MKNFLGFLIFLAIVFLATFCKEKQVALDPFESKCQKASVGELASMLATTEADIQGEGHYSLIAKRIAWDAMKRKISVRDSSLLLRLLQYDGYALGQDLFQEITGVYLAYLPNGMAKEEKRSQVSQLATDFYGGWKKLTEK